ncbi:thioredoxin family protein [Candidatus Woesearchaeota archaeon]|nr:thioredoxin family protein [Candidatus Woesearchaeota archaeon]
MVDIKMFVRKGDKKSKDAKELMEGLVVEMPFIKLNIIDIDDDQITALTHHVMKCPSFCINGLTRFHGEVPEANELKNEIEKALL